MFSISHYNNSMTRNYFISSRKIGEIFYSLLNSSKLDLNYFNKEY